MLSVVTAVGLVCFQYIHNLPQTCNSYTSVSLHFPPCFILCTRFLHFPERFGNIMLHICYCGNHKDLTIGVGGRQSNSLFHQSNSMCYGFPDFHNIQMVPIYFWFILNLNNLLLILWLSLSFSSFCTPPLHYGHVLFKDMYSMDINPILDVSKWDIGNSNLYTQSGEWHCSHRGYFSSHK